MSPSINLNDELSSSRAGHTSLPRRAFTLLEIMVAIAIIAVLATIAVVGLNSIRRSAALKNTHVMLNNVESLQAELEAAGASTMLVRPGGPPGGGAPPPYDTNATVDLKSIGVGNHVIVTGDNENLRFAIANNTETIRSILTTIPKNKDVIGQMPAASIALIHKPGSFIDVRTFVDGWGNPILFVPPGGLSGVNLGKKSDGSFSSINQTIKSPTGRAFWASAGPDGDFTNGDDNVYSFEK